MIVLTPSFILIFTRMHLESLINSLLPQLVDLAYTLYNGQCVFCILLLVINRPHIEMI